MANLNIKLKKVLDNLESNIKDDNTLELVKIQIFELYNMFFEEFNKMEQLANSRLAEMMQMQKDMNDKVESIESKLKSIQKDIYLDDDEDEDFDFTIVCPYCNNEFKTESAKLEDEITCPECKNVIELDWDDECNCEECSHDCHKDDDEDM